MKEIISSNGNSWRTILGLVLSFSLYIALPVFAQEATSSDAIIIKSVDALMFQITANMRLTPDQISAVRIIIADNIVKVRNLQLNLQHGDIDAKTMFSQRQQANSDESEALSHILNPDQMKVWFNIVNS